MNKKEQFEEVECSGNRKTEQKKNDRNKGKEGTSKTYPIF